MKPKFLIKQIVFLILFSSASMSQSNWFWQNPIPTGNDLTNLYFSDSITGYAVGFDFTILKTTDSGENWDFIRIDSNSIPAGLNGNLKAVYFLNSMTGYVGRNGIFKTTNGGDSWIFHSTPEPVNSIFFTTMDIGYASCDRGKIIKTTNGGSNWFVQYEMEDYTILLNKIKFISIDTGFAVGSFQTILKTTNQGDNWVVKNGTSGWHLFDFCFINNTVGYASGNYGKLAKTTNSGENWFYLEGYNFNFRILNNIQFTSIDTGYVLSTYFGSEGKIYKTINGGSSWSLLYDLGYGISKICLLQNDKFVISCDGGNIYKSTNSGVDWINKIKNVSNASLVSISFINEYTGYIAGSNNTVVKTTNSGLEWQALYTPGIQNFSYIKFFDLQNGYLAGTSLYKTSNGGMNWDSVLLLNNLNNVRFLNLDTGYFLREGYLHKTFNGGISWDSSFIIGNATNFYFLENNDTGFVINEYTIGFPISRDYNDLYRTTNNGKSWNLIRTFINGLSSGFYEDILFINNNTGFLAGPLGIVKTTNTGNSWSYTYDGLYGLSGKMYFYNDNIGYISSYNKIYKTTNTGNNWNRVLEVSNNIESYSFTDNNTGYAIGQLGSILKTTNGGGVYVNISGDNEHIPLSFNLYQNYPNPFNPETVIKFDLSIKSRVKLSVTDILGRKVKTITESDLEPGEYSYEFDGSSFASGIYFYKLETENFSQTKRMVLLK